MGNLKARQQANTTASYVYAGGWSCNSTNNMFLHKLDATTGWLAGSLYCHSMRLILFPISFFQVLKFGV
jgi:hypothetical protein